MSKTYVVMLLVAFTTISCKRKMLENKCCAIEPTEIAFEGGYVSVPNIFTPNNDSVFDQFTTQAEGYSSFRIEIFKKSGKSLFVSDDPEIRWNGYLFEDKESGFYDKKMKHGIYTYKVDVTSEKGETVSAEGEFCLVTGESARCFYSSDGCVGSSKYDGQNFVRSVENVPASCDE